MINMTKTYFVFIVVAIVAGSVDFFKGVVWLGVGLFLLVTFPISLPAYLIYLPFWNRKQKEKNEEMNKAMVDAHKENVSIMRNAMDDFFKNRRQ